MDSFATPSRYKPWFTVKIQLCAIPRKKPYKHGHPLDTMRIESCYDVYRNTYTTSFPYRRIFRASHTTCLFADTFDPLLWKSGKIGKEINAIVIIRGDRSRHWWENSRRWSIDGPPWQRFFHGETNCFYAILAPVFIGSFEKFQGGGAHQRFVRTPLSGFIPGQPWNLRFPREKIGVPPPPPPVFSTVLLFFSFSSSPRRGFSTRKQITIHPSLLSFLFLLSFCDIFLFFFFYTVFFMVSRFVSSL